MTPQPSEQPPGLREFVEEASPGPWRRETGVAPSEEEHMVWLTNEAQDSLLVNADDVAMLVNAAIEATAPDPVASPHDVHRLAVALHQAGITISRINYHSTSCNATWHLEQAERVAFLYDNQPEEEPSDG